MSNLTAVAGGPIRGISGETIGTIPRAWTGAAAPVMPRLPRLSGCPQGRCRIPLIKTAP